MEETLEFNFVYSKDALRIKTFLGGIPRNIECINYLDRLINDTDDYNIDSYGEDLLNRIKAKLTK